MFIEQFVSFCLRLSPLGDDVELLMDFLVRFFLYFFFFAARRIYAALISVPNVQ